MLGVFGAGTQTKVLSWLPLPSPSLSVAPRASPWTESDGDGRGSHEPSSPLLDLEQEGAKPERTPRVVFRQGCEATHRGSAWRGWVWQLDLSSGRPALPRFWCRCRVSVREPRKLSHGRLQDDQTDEARQALRSATRADRATKAKRAVVRLVARS